MKKFLTRALPLCLALLIFVGSLAVPAFAADVYTLSGKWSFNENVDFSGIDDAGFRINGSFTAHGDQFVAIDIRPSYIALVRDNESTLLYFDGDWKQVVRSFNITDQLTLDAAAYSWIIANSTLVGDIPLFTDEFDSGVSIVAVFTGISTWIVDAFGNLMPMFYTEGVGLTFIGTLAVAGLAFAVFFLIFMIIRRFLNFGG